MSFRRMSLKEAHEVHPLRIKIVTAEHGDTQEKLARRMAMPDHQIELFRVINGLSHNDAIKPGEKLKIVVE
jgi:predicted Zn-dependent protease